jgi:hypothetical protein
LSERAFSLLIIIIYVIAIFAPYGRTALLCLLENVPRPAGIYAFGSSRIGEDRKFE